MQIYKPSYYDTFRCIAQKCPDSCCKEWEVEVDDRAAAFYRNLPGPLGDRLREVLRDDPDWGTVMTIENHRCPMWRQDGLCRIQAELGHDALCKTCREFPRLRHDYGSFQELGLELACPEAARIILTAPDATLQQETAPGGDTPEYDEELMELLLRTRTEALAILMDPRYSPGQALSLLLYFGYHAQSLIDDGQAPDFQPDLSLSEAMRFAKPGGEQALLDFFAGLEILDPGWKSRLQGPLSPAPWTDAFRKLARYFVERYYLQAVSDYDIVSRVKLVAVSCIVIRLLGGDLIQTAQHYSKEIENSDQNVDLILDAAYTSSALTDRMLLGMLL
ncbi:MAG: hypothetical protein E7447_06620 [Ruminococcaceae bacterium]|nr:hypothetical protein [Oscillospiraceae bacterium]